MHNRQLGAVDEESLCTSYGQSNGVACGPKLFLAALEPDPRPSRAVRAVQRARADRARVLDAKLFADPAWDILLELYASELEQKRISIIALCKASGVADTTGIRWLDALAKQDLVERRCDPFDARRVRVSLSRKGLEAMSGLFSALPPNLRSL